jgi:hypothetical protein
MAVRSVVGRLPEALDVATRAFGVEASSHRSRGRSRAPARSVHLQGACDDVAQALDGGDAVAILGTVLGCVQDEHPVERQSGRQSFQQVRPLLVVERR